MKSKDEERREDAKTQKRKDAERSERNANRVPAEGRGQTACKTIFMDVWVFYITSSSLNPYFNPYIYLSFSALLLSPSLLLSVPLDSLS